MQNQGSFKMDLDMVWGVIPARGGSKSIPKKNLVELGGYPLVFHVIEAAKLSKKINRFICSTDDVPIASFVRSLGVEVHDRPKNLAEDMTPVLEVFSHLLMDIGRQEGLIADILVILQPTSPFLRPEDVIRAVTLLKNEEQVDSVQTITEFPHNYHAFNQRIVQEGWVSFRFPEERKKYYNKNTKPKHYMFGNLIVTRSRTILNQNDIFGERSKFIQIPFPYALDVDGPDDLDLAKYYLQTQKVNLPWIG
ncbi:MAG: acylneuraminate cytidylyltransferase family protein [Deltaproteobacteria bacterium]|nr:acylneuraminate cytidylyltransferase family protein [Deltaproteobacteria bacterium]